MRGAISGWLGLVLVLSAVVGTTPEYAAAAAGAPTAAHSARAAHAHGSAAKPKHHKARPKVKKVKPNTGPTSGGTVVKVKGKHLKKTKKVLFGAARGTGLLVKNDHKLIVTAPAHAAGVVDVVVKIHGGKSRTGRRDRFTYTGPTTPPPAGTPVIAALAPSTGSTIGGTSVTITGTGLTGATAVTFGGIPGTALVVASDGVLSVTSPAHAAGIVPVMVTTPVGTSASAAYTYVSSTGTTPTVVAVLPLVGSTSGGTAVTITGTGFTGLTGVSFGGSPASNVQFISDNAISAVTPAHAAGVVNVTVSNASGTGTGLGLFLYVGITGSAPVVLAALPLIGSPAGGTSVTITGTGFTGATAVSFGGTPASSFLVTSDTSITAVTPAHALGLVNVTVTNAAGPGTGIGLFTYLGGGGGGSAPTVLAAVPPIGSIAGGTSVTILGTGFTGATAVAFGGVAATNFSVQSDNTITATTPAHALGLVSVTVTNASGPGTGLALYTYLLP